MSRCRHTSVTVTYRAPVLVDVEDGKVVRVVVHHEAVAGPIDSECAECLQRVPAAERTAEDAVEGWPHWELGF